MESQSSKRGAIQGDRLSGLPDDILHSILHSLPLKDVVRTSIVSRQFKKMWLDALANSPVLDFTDRDFVRASDQTPARAVGIVGSYLELHNQFGAPLHVLRVALDGASGGITAVVGWVVSTVTKGAREVEVDLTPVRHNWAAAQPDADNEFWFLELPDGLFLARNSLMKLALDRFSFRAFLPGAVGLAGLRSLSLSHTDVTDEGVQTVLSSCHLLEFLSLRCCHLLTSVKIIGDKLRGLELASCLAMRELRVAARALESFAFHGDIVYMRDEDGGFIPTVDLGATPFLRDAYLSHIGFGDLYDSAHTYAYSNFISFIEYAETLTICSTGLLLLAQDGYDDYFNIDSEDVKELQLLIASFDINLDAVTTFFRRNSLPLLDRLFIRVICKPTYDGGVAAPLIGEDIGHVGMFFHSDDFVLDRLRFIKVVNLWGTMLEMKMIAFLLARAPALQHLVLVAADEEGAPGFELLKIFQDQLMVMTMMSPDVCITLCRPRDDDTENPTHSRFYHEE